ncbi:MAG: hypothetical protein Nk1A_8130 [Endomicrobiia bacterium]|nr:MAG: hypothetical protein Nk1A_8130 [Endomicrobiia bacterium]
MRYIYNDNGELIPYKQGSRDKFDFTSVYDRETFKFWFEHDFLPELKTKYPDNIFLKHLNVGAFPDNFGGSYTLATLPINMMSVSEADEDAFALYSNHFVMIKNNKERIGDVPIGSGSYEYTNEELFFIYNLLINKNRPGEFALTRIFDTSIWEYITNPNKPLNRVLEFFNFEGMMLNEPGLKFSKDDYSR